MYILITVLIIIVCALLVLVVLVQNPKGGGLSGTFGGFSDQMMGVQRTTDFLEKSTWTLAIVLLSFSLLSSFFVIMPESEEQDVEKSAIEEQIQNAPLPQMPQQNLGGEQQQETDENE